MTNIDKVTASKTAFRIKLARLPIGAKLQLLDKMRERELSIRRSTGTLSLCKKENSDVQPG